MTRSCDSFFSLVGSCSEERRPHDNNSALEPTRRGFEAQDRQSASRYNWPHTRQSQPTLCDYVTLDLTTTCGNSTNLRISEAMFRPSARHRMGVRVLQQAQLSSQIKKVGHGADVRLRGI